MFNCNIDLNDVRIEDKQVFIENVLLKNNLENPIRLVAEIFDIGYRRCEFENSNEPNEFIH